MATRYTEAPSEALPGEVVGQPIRLPAVLVCTQGERHCGWARMANTRDQFIKYAAERRDHEMKCNGGLIVVVG
jgi:hypothetical protein